VTLCGFHPPQLWQTVFSVAGDTHSLYLALFELRFDDNIQTAQVTASGNLSPTVDDGADVEWKVGVFRRYSAGRVDGDVLDDTVFDRTGAQQTVLEIKDSEVWSGYPATVPTNLTASSGSCSFQHSLHTPWKLWRRGASHAKYPAHQIKWHPLDTSDMGRGKWMGGLRKSSGQRKRNHSTRS
jgi:hypothetical protein